LKQLFDADIRKTIIVDHPEGFEKYLDKMATPGEWGDAIVLIAASACYVRRIVVVLNGGSSIPIVARNVAPTAEKIFLRYTEDNKHYVSLTPK
jgi:hypothetical protein